MLTQCPHCQARFKITEQHLQAANGKVRCGACREVFDARNHLIETAPVAPAVSSQPPMPAEQDSPMVRAVAKQRVTRADDGELLFQDDPEEDQTEAGYAGKSFNESQLSDDFRHLDQSGNAPFSEQNDEEASATVADESWAEQMLSEMTPIRAEKASATASSRTPDLTLSEPGGSPTQRRANPSNPLLGETALRADPRPGYAQFKAQPVRIRAGEAPRQPWRVARIISLSLLVAGLLAVLTIQLAFHHYERLAHFSSLQSMMAEGCALWNRVVPWPCRLPELKALEQIRSEELVVRSHPLTPGALIIDAAVVNDAPFPQAWPAINLSFSDINNNVVAQRVFTPEEYLSGTARAMPQMPSGTPIHFSLELRDPGKQAVNYTISFRDTQP